MLSISPLARLLAAVLFAASDLLLLGCNTDLAAPGDEPSIPIPAVEAVPARSGTLPLEERLSGVVKAQGQVAIRPEISASVVEVLVASGDAVREGQPLVRLEDDRLRDQLRQAEASVSLAAAQAKEARARVAALEAQFRRTRALAEQDLVSPLQRETEQAQLDAAEAAADQADARVEQALATAQERRTAISKAVVRAPVTGRVGQRNAEVGMLVDPGTVLFRIGNLDRVRVEIPLTEENLGSIHQGLPVRIVSNAHVGDPLHATLTRISPFLEEGSFSTVGEIDVDNRDGRLRPGMFLTVDVLYGESAQATLVPASALWEDPQSGALGIFVVTDLEGDEPRPAKTDQERPDVALPIGPTAEPASPGSTATVPRVPREIHPIELRRVEVSAEGRGVTGVDGIEAGEWVVTLGQHLLAGRESPTARVRRASWEHVAALQSLQREDLLEGFLDKQRRVARERGATIPSTEEYLGLGSETEEGAASLSASGADGRARP